MKKTFILITLALCFWGVSAGALASAAMAAGTDPSAGGLVTCGRGDGTPGNPAATNCDFAALINMVNTIIRYMIFIAMPLAAIAFAYAGWIYLSAGGDTGAVKKAKHIFASVGIGFVLILSAWLIFQYIAKTFLSTKYYDPSNGVNSTYLK